MAGERRRMREVHCAGYVLFVEDQRRRGIDDHDVLRFLVDELLELWAEMHGFET